jgi:hypothetical protein
MPGAMDGQTGDKTDRQTHLLAGHGHGGGEQLDRRTVSMRGAQRAGLSVRLVTRLLTRVVSRGPNLP